MQNTATEIHHLSLNRQVIGITISVLATNRCFVGDFNFAAIKYHYRFAKLTFLPCQMTLITQFRKRKHLMNNC